MYPESSEGLNRETKEAVYFFTTAFHPFDNFSAHAISLWGRIFPTAEHAFQWKKFSISAPDVSEKIFLARSPHAVKLISDSLKDNIPNDWHGIKVGVMEEILRAKVDQHDDVKELLLKTGSRLIIENSPFDKFWGRGVDGTGQNKVGEIYMKIRKSLV